MAHAGHRADGEFAHSLNVTDIHTTWVETRAVLGRGEGRVQAALEEIRQALPFRLRGIDSDNGSEFINNHLYRYCQAQEIQFTRGRPYKKDDNAHIEQKNWTHVRKLVGYWRYDTPTAVAALNALYRHELRLFHNLFLPSVKLARQGAGRGAAAPPLRCARARRSSGSRPAPRRIPRPWPRSCAFAISSIPSPWPQAIDRKIERLVALATPARAAGVPTPTAASFPLIVPAPPKPRPGRPPGIPDFTFGNRLRRPQARPSEGYMLDGSTIHPSVSFLDGLTGERIGIVALDGRGKGEQHRHHTRWRARGAPSGRVLRGRLRADCHRRGSPRGRRRAGARRDVHGDLPVREVDPVLVERLLDPLVRLAPDRRTAPRAWR